MKRKYIIKSIAAVIMLFSVSCNEWLNLEPENDLIRQEFWKKESDVDAVLAAMYDSFRDLTEKNLIMGELRGDLLEINSSKYGGYARIYNNEITPSMGEIDWSGYYKTINLANTLIQFQGDVVGLDEEFTAREKDGYEAEAIFIRSLSYFYLVRLWKDVPLILSASSSDTVDFFQPKSEERVVLRQLIKDLKVAEEKAFTTEKKDEDIVFKGRANKYSIQALMADIYLWLEDYENCINYCDKVINSGQYKLMDNLHWFDLYYPGNSAESIFEIQFHADYEGEENPIYNNLVSISSSTQGFSSVDDLSDIFPVGDIRRLGAKNSAIIIGAKKYTYSSIESDTKRNDNERDGNFIFYRLADIILMKAEALAELERYNESAQMLNLTMERAGIPPVQLEDSKDNFREAILMERGREFLYEGKRWFDLLRFAKKNNFENKQLLMTILLTRSDIKTRPKLEARVRDSLFYFLPIAERELDANEKLVQNPFYDK